MRRSEAVALAFEDREYTVGELERLASGLAAELARRGVRPDDRVALMSSNRPEFVVALLAIWRLGAAVVLLSPAWKRAEVEHALAITSPAHAVGDSPVLGDLLPMRHLDDPITEPSVPVAAHPPAPDSGAVLVFSSGTTGLLKAVCHTHSSLAAAVFGVDARDGEAIVAAVIRSASVTADELIALVGTRLAHYKRPRAVMFVSEIPRLPSGKVLRRILKEQCGRSSDE